MLRVLLFALFVSAAPLAAQSFGETSFPNSGNAEAQEPFLRGLLQLHSFEYRDAMESFQEAQRLDPDFAMAYWGEAMTHNHPIWQQQDREAALAVLARLAPTPDGQLATAGTERERDYFRALHVLYGEGEKEDRDDAFSVAMADLASRYPEDHDAATFYALAVLGTAHEGRDFTTYMKAAAIAEEVFAENPRHPGAAHYLIHAYDDPVHAPLGLRAARVYSEIAPSASHALHMPTHIYFALGQWEEATALNIRSYEAARNATAARGEGLNGHGWHALYWLHYSELQRGRFEEARRLFDLAQSIATDEPSSRGTSSLITMRANHVIETQDGSSDVAMLDLASDETSDALFIRDAFVRGWAALQRGDRESAVRAQDGIRSRIEETERSEARAHALMLDALLALDAGETDSALESLTAATAVVDAMPLDFGPPSPVKPAHELLGDVLLSLDRPGEALEQYQHALTRSPGRVLSLMGVARAQNDLGDREASTAAWAHVGAIRASADPAVRASMPNDVLGSR